MTPASPSHIRFLGHSPSLPHCHLSVPQSPTTLPPCHRTCLCPHTGPPTFASVSYHFTISCTHDLWPSWKQLLHASQVCFFSRGVEGTRSVLTDGERGVYHSWVRMAFSPPIGIQSISYWAQKHREKEACRAGTLSLAKGLSQDISWSWLWSILVFREPVLPFWA